MIYIVNKAFNLWNAPSWYETICQRIKGPVNLLETVLSNGKEELTRVSKQD